jgi:hypothetical protein
MNINLPTIIFTRNGLLIGGAIGPRNANDVRILWTFDDFFGGYGFWTRNGRPIPNSGFFVPPGTNDFHFSTNGIFGQNLIPLIPPPGVNDLELNWSGEMITEAWWTINGIRFSRVPLKMKTAEFYFAVKKKSQKANTRKSRKRTH